MAMAGEPGSLRDYCPLPDPGPADQRNGFGGKGEAVPLWLMPASGDVGYEDMCRCFSMLAGLHPATRPTENPDWCQEVQTREHWIGVLSSLGAKPIGGEIGDPEGTLAWHYKGKAGREEITVFTIPLRPSRRTGISYAHLPLLTRNLLQWQGVYSGPQGSRERAWPRISDISGTTPDMIKANPRLVEEANVPAGESMLSRMEKGTLPPLWENVQEGEKISGGVKKDRDDPLPWIRICALLVIGISALEGLWFNSRFLIGYALRSRMILLFGLLPLLLPGEAEARVKLNIVGFSGNSWSAGNLSREVSARTSIMLDRETSNSLYFRDEILSEPWVWAARGQAVSGVNGELRQDLVQWIKRGGFLVVEMADAPGLRRLTRRSFGQPGERDGWKPIPPDHEIMRSFHLLDSLPACDEKLWYGFQYDGRLAILGIPHGFLTALLDQKRPDPCYADGGYERLTRVFINVLMVALATDYKKDQIHLPEILKRLR